MKLYRWKKVLGITLSLVLLVGCNTANTEGGGGTSENLNNATDSETGDTDTSSEKVKVTALSTWAVSDVRPVKDQTVVGQKIEQDLNMDLELITVPNEALGTQINGMLASGELPDMFFKFTNYQQAIPYGERDVILNVNDYLDHVPNYKKILDDNEYIRKTMTDNNGNIWGFPSISNSKSIFYTTPLIRQDVLKDLGIEATGINTLDDLTNTLRQVTELKGSPAWIQRNGYTDFMQKSGLLWNLSNQVFYDYEIDSFSYITKHERSYDYITWLKTLIDENVIHPDWVVMSDETWEGLLASDQGYFTIDRFNIVGDQNFSQDFDWQPVDYPEINGNRFAQPQTTPVNPNSSWYINANADEASLYKALEFIDYLYNPANEELLQIGVEDETFTRDNPNTEAGIRWLIQIYGENANNPDSDVMFLHGIQSFQRVRTDLEMTSQPGIFPTVMREQVEHIETNIGGLQEPAPVVNLPEDIRDTILQKENSIQTFVDEGIMAFLQGERDLSEWSDFVNEIDEIGIDEILDAYNDALDLYNNK